MSRLTHRHHQQYLLILVLLVMQYTGPPANTQQRYKSMFIRLVLFCPHGFLLQYLFVYRAIAGMCAGQVTGAH